MTTTPQDRRSPAPKTAAKPRATKAAAKPAAKPAEEKAELTPSELIELEQEQKELRRELLAELPTLRPAITFRMRHRNDFQNLLLDAAKSGAFDEDTDGPLVFDETSKDDIERLQKLNEFIACIDEWAEGIADDPAAYDKWSQGKTHDHFMALFMEYRDALGE
ncbi:hypothetical protein SOM10_11790 [Microbacterium sp. CFBP9023]|uniref:hypothetical protein n=1 Tax=Microbacterium sp. CFBP9023 TaxID=3096535 RepID=UPI002A69E816|nr:hypothetical protein [Microbacterium sp. CFBP9023]MDY0984578.1 hypothetical protein [Microbacterium sp. CFBP9023]